MRSLSLSQVAFASEACLTESRDIDFIVIIFLWFRLHHERDPHQSRYTGQGELRQAMFRAPFLAPSLCYGGEQGGPKEGFLVTQEAAGLHCCLGPVKGDHFS